MSIRVRKNVREVHTLSAVIGFVLMLASVAIVIIAVLGARRRRLGPATEVDRGFSDS